MDNYSKVQEALGYLRKRLPMFPEIGATLGSGLGFLVDQLTDKCEIPFGDIPHFPSSAVPGHSGKLVVGLLDEVPVLLLCGRVHLYEGYSPQEVTLATRVAIALGVRTMILTNAAGAVSPHWSAGDIMLMSDHVNFQGTNALVGPQDDRLGERFVDMTDAYDSALRGRIRHWAAARGISLREGVYGGLLGPSYETKAEIRMFRGMGIDAAGMSTVQEAIVARQMRARLVGLSVLTNLAAGVSAGPLSHEEVKETAARVQGQFCDLIAGIVALVGAKPQDTKPV